MKRFPYFFDVWSGMPYNNTLDASCDARRSAMLLAEQRGALLETVKKHLEKQKAKKEQRRISPENFARVNSKVRVLTACLESLEKNSDEHSTIIKMEKIRLYNYTQADGWVYKTSDTGPLVDEVCRYFEAYQSRGNTLYTSLHNQHYGSTSPAKK